MKTNKRLLNQTLNSVLTGALVLSLTACGSEKKSSSTDDALNPANSQSSSGSLGSGGSGPSGVFGTYYNSQANCGASDQEIIDETTAVGAFVVLQISSSQFIRRNGATFTCARYEEFDLVQISTDEITLARSFLGYRGDTCGSIDGENELDESAIGEQIVYPYEVRADGAILQYYADEVEGESCKNFVDENLVN